MAYLIRYLLLIIFISIFSLFYTPNVSAGDPWDFPPPEQTYQYSSGREICDYFTNTFRVGEQGFYVKVPIDYNDPEGEKTEIFAWTMKVFDSNKPSVIYVNGGPGSSAHSTEFNNLDQYNMISFDQRGIACSRAASEKMQNNYKFHSSVAIAMDIESIRRHLNVPQITIYGHSFGTVLATIYSSLYAENVKALILEGTIYEANSTLWSGPHRIKVLQQFFDHLEPHLQETAINMDIKNGDGYFSSVAKSLMYTNNFEKVLLGILKRNYEQNQNKTEEIPPWMNHRKKFNSSKSIDYGLLEIDDITWSMITCQELASSDEKSVTVYKFLNRKLVPLYSTTEFENRIKNCEKYGISKSNHNIYPYLASDYPIIVPVTYFQGANDGATVVPQPFNHYKKVPIGPKQLLVMPNGGHSPNLNLVHSGTGEFSTFPEKKQQLGKIQSEIFTFAAEGKKIPSELIERFNKLSENPWRYTGNIR